MDPIANMLVQIKNAQAVSKDHVLVPFSKMKFTIANILSAENFVGSIEKKSKTVKKTEHQYIQIDLKYDDNGQGAISGIKLISRPSRRMYIGSKDIKPIRSGYGVAVLSTPKGVLSSKEAKKSKVGGEILFEIY